MSYTRYPSFLGNYTVLSTLQAREAKRLAVPRRSDLVQVDALFKRGRPSGAIVTLSGGAVGVTLRTVFCKVIVRTSVLSPQPRLPLRRH